MNKMQLSAPIRLVRDILKFAKKRQCPELNKTVKIFLCINRVGVQFVDYTITAQKLDDPYPIKLAIKAY